MARRARSKWQTPAKRVNRRLIKQHRKRLQGKPPTAWLRVKGL